MAARQRPRDYEAVAGFIGTPVRVAGTALNGQMDGDVRDIEALAEAASFHSGDACGGCS